jgi:hypothetical protein
MRKCDNCVRLQQRISDLNNELLVLRIAAVVAKDKSAAGGKLPARVAAKAGLQLKTARDQAGVTSSRSPVFTS